MKSNDNICSSTLTLIHTILYVSVILGIGLYQFSPFFSANSFYNALAAAHLIDLKYPKVIELDPIYMLSTNSEI